MPCTEASSGAVWVDQSALTGESAPVMLRAGRTMLAGSVCTRGEARAIVTHTGGNTRAARAAASAAGGPRGVLGGSGGGSGLVERARVLLLLLGGGGSGGGGGGGIDSLYGQTVREGGGRADGGGGGGGTSKFDRVLADITNALSAAGLLACFFTGVTLMLWGGAGVDLFSVAAFCVVLLVASAPIAARVVCGTTIAVGCRQGLVNVARHRIDTCFGPSFIE